MMSQGADQGALFNKEYTHVGISCGCHATDSEMCCFMYGKDAVDKRGVQTMDVMMVNKMACEDSAKWSEGLSPNAGYNQPDSKPAPIPQVATPKPVPGPAHYTEPKMKNYEELSNEVFNSYKILVNDKDEWLEAVDNKDVIN